MGSGGSGGNPSLCTGKINRQQGDKTMRVILFELWGFPIRSYGLVVVLAVALAIGVTQYFAKQAGKDTEQVLNLSLYAVIGGLIGARLWEVLFFQPTYYFNNPKELLAIWHGGLSIQGGLVGGVLTGVWYLRKLGWKFWETADLLLYIRWVQWLMNNMEVNHCGRPKSGKASGIWLCLPCCLF